MENTISVKNVTKNFKSKVRESGFIGSNGAGKTTTLKMLSGLIYPTSGEVKVLGYKPHERKHDFLKNISLVMGQKNQLWWDLPVIESFNLNKEIYDVSDSKFKSILEELVEMLDLKHLLNIQVRKLSLGERMKCELVAALIHTPKVLFLDEPTIGLDINMQKKVRQFIKEYNLKYKTTIILTSHYMEDVQFLCERVIMINKGNLIYDGKVKELITKNGDFKLIKVHFEQPTEFKLSKELGKKVQVIKQEESEVELKLLKRDVSEVAMYIHQNFNVDDLDISEPKLEDIVAKLL